MDEILAYLRESSGPGVLLVLFAAAALEYMLPFVPGDSIVLGGSLLVVSGAWSFPIVYATAVAGGFVGSVTHYVIGRYLVGPDGSIRASQRIERFLGKGSLEKFFAAFRKYGLWVIAINRGIPGIRSACFIAAGAARISPVRALGAGLVSNLLWSAGLLLMGVSIGGNWEKIQEAFGVYKWVAFGIAACLVITVLIVRRIKKRKKTE